MKLTEICIKRPVLSTVLSLALLVVGIVAFTKLSIRHYPKIDRPKMSITTQFEGASADIVETQVTKILENVLGSLEGLDDMTSKSESGESIIFLSFQPTRNIDDAANDVRNAISRVKTKLPQDIRQPLIRKSSADALPMLNLVMYSDRQPVKDVSDFIKSNIENQIESIQGISGVDVWGGGEYNMYVRIDPIRLAAFNLTTEEVRQAIRNQNLEKPAGHLVSKDLQIPVTTKASLKTEKQFRDIVIAERKGQLVRLADVADITFDAVSDAFRTRFKGPGMEKAMDAVNIAITKQSTANPLDISREVRKLLPTLRQSLPPGMYIEIANDKSQFINRSIDEVYQTIFEATLLVILVMVFFLRSFRAAIIPIVTIPLSLIGTFALMYALGFSVNVLTLLALVMAIGLVVDDAIVMLENIYQYIERGYTPMEAAFKGAKEISFAVVAMTLTLAAVYAPIALSEGMTGKLFSEFALSLAGSVIISGFVALTLSPMMCGFLLKSHADTEKARKDRKKRAKTSQWAYLVDKLDTLIGRYLDKFDQGYKNLLKSALTKKVRVKVPYTQKSQDFKTRQFMLFGAFMLSALGVFLYTSVKENLSPAEDQGVVKVRADVPRGSNIEYIDRYMQQAEKHFTYPEQLNNLTILQVRGDSSIESRLVPWEERNRSSMEIADKLRKELREITGLRFMVSGRGRSLVSAGRRGKPVEFVVQTTKSYDELVEIFRDFISSMRHIDGIDQRTIEDTMPNDEQEFVVEINREKAAAMGVDVRKVAETLNTLIKGGITTYMEASGNRYPVTVELQRDYRRTKEDIESIYIKAHPSDRRKKEDVVPLSEIVDLKQQLLPASIWHTSGMRSITVEADILPGYGIGKIIENLKQLAKQTLPDGSRISMTGESKRFLEESYNFLFIFLLSIVSIYFVLSAQYESFRDPLIILFSVPMALVGGILFLMVMDGNYSWKGLLPSIQLGTMSIFGKIGLVTLVGLITKHGILIVDFANKLLEEGKDRLDAVIEASGQRLRPILMTTLAMVLGAIPLALADGAGAESRRQIGWVIVGGMSLGTFFTLFIVPAVYYYFSWENFKRFGQICASPVVRLKNAALKRG